MKAKGLWLVLLALLLVLPATVAYADDYVDEYVEGFFYEYGDGRITHYDNGQIFVCNSPGNMGASAQQDGIERGKPNGFGTLGNIPDPAGNLHGVQ